jgi:hypothetical protein
MAAARRGEPDSERPAGGPVTDSDGAAQRTAAGRARQSLRQITVTSVMVPDSLRSPRLGARSQWWQGSHWAGPR